MFTTNADTLETVRQPDTDYLPPKAEIYQNMPEYRFRTAFRGVLMIYFGQTNRGAGSYIWAEKQAKQYFLDKYTIPLDAWSYRNPKEH